MKRSAVTTTAMSLVLYLLFAVVAISTIAQAVEGPKTCAQCGMYLTIYPQCRMFITYNDGTNTDVCSLTCAIKQMRQYNNKPVKSLMVANYMTQALIDAKMAIWVVGGNQNGGMNAPAKWAFATEEDARKFVDENGGQITSFDQVMKDVGEKSDATMSGWGCEFPGGQLIFNPAFGDDIYHVHPGMWMVGYKYMHMKMEDLRSGTSDVGIEDIGFRRNKRYEYMMIPTSMTMDMHMVMLMYGITDRFTLMAMPSYLVNRMDMLMDMGPIIPITASPAMRTDGPGDTELRGIWAINDNLMSSLGISLPTGDVDQTVSMMGWEFRAPYDMQLGSGTYDLKPALSYSALSSDALWNWGAQAMYIYHISENKNDYTLGDVLKLNSWVQRAFGPAASWFRLAFNDTQRIHGRDAEIQKLLYPADPAYPGKWASTPDADPDNYGGHRLYSAVGVSYRLGPFSIGVEGGMPFYQYLNGLQLKTEWFLSAGAQAMF